MVPPSARAAARWLAPLVPFVAALIVWRTLLDNYFLADDFLHLFDVVTVGLPRFLTQIWGGHLYLVRNAVFAGMYYTFGPEPRPWFWSVLLTHLVNVLLLYRVIHRLTASPLLACLGATLWGSSPVLEGALGWYSVYGQVLLTTIVLLVTSWLAATIDAGPALSTRRAVGWGALLAAGGACFGTGLGLAAAFPLVVMVVLPRSRRSARAVGVLVVAAAVVFGVYGVLRTWSPPGFDPRSRELLSMSAMARDAPTVLALAVSLLGFGASALLLGPWGLDAGYPDPVTLVTTASVAAIVAAGWIAAGAARRRPLLGLGMLVLTAYAAIAAGRAAVLESVQVSIVRSSAWPRYHYLPLALLTILLCSALGSLGARGRASRTIVSGAALLWIAARLFSLAIVPWAIDHHDPERAETETVLQGIRQSVAAASPGAAVTIQNRVFHSAGIPGLFPGWAGVFVIHFREDTVEGHPVRFLAADGDWTLAQSRGGRIARLLVRR